MRLGLEVCIIHSLYVSLQHPTDYANNRRKSIKHTTPVSWRGLVASLMPPFSKTPSFASVCVLEAPALVQLSCPQDHPLGQQLPPSVAAQLYHPVAHVPEAVVVAAPVSGTTIVSPELMRVV